MANICILLQALLGFHVFYKVQLNEGMLFEIISILIAHFILYLMYKLSSPGKAKKLIGAADFILLIASAALINSSFWIVLIAAGMEFTYYSYKKVMAAGIFLIFLFLLITNRALLAEEGTMWVLVVLFLSSLLYSQEKIIHIKKMNEELRGKLHDANRKIDSIQKETNQIEEMAKVQERNLLVQKLHDKIGHNLAANIMQLEAVKILFKSNQEEAVKLLEGAVQNLRTGMDDIRYTLRNLKPEKSELGLTQVKSILEELQNNHQIETELLFEGDIEVLGLNIWHVIIQNLKEAVTNLIKYSEADRLIVRIEIFHKIIKVQFKDNGKPVGHYTKGLGLMGMEERTQSINGRLMINTENGFEILMVLNREEL